MQRPDTDDGLFHSGNPLTGEKGTPIPVDWLNALLSVAVLISGNVEPPAAELGGEDDIYLCRVTRNFYGPKAAGEWGDPWQQGVPGARGFSVLSAERDPLEEDGINGDWFINAATLTIFGPKTAGVWGAGTALRGSQGIQGPAGAALASVWADVMIINESMALGGYDVIYLGDTAAGALTWTAPTAIGKKGRQIYVENIGAAGNDLTINGLGAETVEGQEGVLLEDGIGLKFYSDDANWRRMKG